MENLNLAHPWPDFHKDIISSLREIIVSYRTDAKVNGTLTEDKYLGVQTSPADQGGSSSVSNSRVRKRAIFTPFLIRR